MISWTLIHFWFNLAFFKIDTAVRFLRNPKVIQTPESNKREFLAKKGMTESEISEALKQANVQVALVTLNEPSILPGPSNAVQLKQSVWLIVIKWIRNFLFAGCLAFTAYKLIIKVSSFIIFIITLVYIYWNFVELKKYFVAKKNKLEITIEKLAATNLKLNESILEMKQSLNTLKTSVESIAQIEKQNPTVNIWYIFEMRKNCKIILFIFVQIKGFI